MSRIGVFWNSFVRRFFLRASPLALMQLTPSIPAAPLFTILVYQAVAGQMTITALMFFVNPARCYSPPPGSARALASAHVRDAL